MGKLIIDGNSVYEIDETCMRNREQKEARKESRNSRIKTGRTAENTEKANTRR